MLGLSMSNADMWRQKNLYDHYSTMIWQGDNSELGFANSVKKAKENLVLGYIQG